jgi:hypothetical protein
MSILTRLTGVTRAALIASLVVAAGPASAMTVIYSWTPDPGQGGSGSMTFTSASITDAANFSAIPVGALTALTYTWNNGATINLSSVLTNNAPSWTACAGFLITGFQITANSVPATAGTFSLQNSAGSCFAGPTVLPGPGFNATNSVLYGAEGNAGHWTLSSVVVPVPAAVWLLVSGLTTLAGLRLRQRI